MFTEKRALKDLTTKLRNFLKLFKFSSMPMIDLTKKIFNFLGVVKSYFIKYFLSDSATRRMRKKIDNGNY